MASDAVGSQKVIGELGLEFELLSAVWVWGAAHKSASRELGLESGYTREVLQNLVSVLHGDAARD